MTEKNESVVAGLNRLANGYLEGGPKDLILQAADSISNLSKDYLLLLDANKMVNDKCERLMGEIKRLEMEYVTGTGEAVADLKEQLNAATKRENDLQNENTVLVREYQAVVKRFDQSLARGQMLVESVAALSRTIEKTAAR